MRRLIASFATRESTSHWPHLVGYQSGTLYTHCHHAERQRAVGPHEAENYIPGRSSQSAPHTSRGGGRKLTEGNEAAGRQQRQETGRSIPKPSKHRGSSVRTPLRYLYAYNIMNAPIEDGEWVDDSYDNDDGHYGQYEEELYPQPPAAEMCYYGPPVRYGPVSGPMMTASAPTETTGTDENALISRATAADALLPSENTGGEKTGGDGDPEDLFDGYRDRFEEENGPPVDGKLAKIANAIWSQGRNTTIMKETFAKYPRPENVSCYKVDVNDEILQGLTRNQTAKNRDSRLRTAQGTVARACLPAVKIAEAVMDWTKEISRK